MKKSTYLNLTFFAVLLLMAGILLRYFGLEFVSQDFKVHLSKWFDKLAQVGSDAWGTKFSNYTPPYLYLLWMATKTSPWIPKLTAIKTISLLFDLGNAAWVYKIVRVKYPQGSVPFFGMALFFILPTVLLNSAWWGQADAIYTFFILGCFYFLLKDQPLPALTAFGVALSFKLQAIFFAPFLFLLFLKRRIRWVDFLIIPPVYLLMMLPAYLRGRPILELLSIYLSQADSYHFLTMNAPNLYHFISNNYYQIGVPLGLSAAFLIALVWAVWYARRIKFWTADLLLVCAAVSVIMMPFFLPKMHDRYFYLADVFILLLAIYLPKLWPAVAASQLISLSTYAIFLLTEGKPDSFLVPYVPALQLFAAILNTFLLAYLLWKQYKLACLTPHPSA